MAALDTAPVVQSLEDLRISPTASLFEGGDRIPVSSFVVTCERGQGPGLHVHPYAEVFIVQAGSARFSVGGSDVDVAAGHVLVVPPGTPHGFTCTSDDQLRVVSVHPSPAVEQTWL